MAEKAKVKVKKRREKVISSIVVLTIVLSVLAASVATVSAEVGPLQPPNAPTEIEVTAEPSSIPAAVGETSVITATVTNWTTQPQPNGFLIKFEITSGQAYGFVDPTSDETNVAGDAVTILTLLDPVPGAEITIKATSIDNPSVFNTTTVTLTGPPIITGYNNKTGSLLSVTINESECVYFNATADQPIDTWGWFIDGVDQSHNSDKFTYSWAEGGEYYVAVNATNDNGTSNTVTWTVTVTYVPVITSIEVLPSTKTLNVSETQQFTATAKDQYNTVMPDVEFTWTSSNETVGTVDENGLFTASYPGFTFVNATADGVTGSASVTVGYIPEITNVTVSPSDAWLNVSETQQFTATAYDQYNNVMPDVEFTWTSSNETVGAVDDGLFTASYRGFTFVNATADGVTGSANVTVSLYAPDLIVTEITPNCGCLFANESNNINATIKNNGTDDAGAFDVRFAVDDGYSEEVRIDGLTAGASEEVTVTDTTIRNAGASVTITVIADCDGEVPELNETNNETVQAETVVNNGYKSKSFAGLPSLVLHEHATINGSIVYTVGNSSKVELAPADTNTTGFDITIPGGATVKTARLYVYWYDSWYSVVHGDADLEVTFDGLPFTTPDASYTDGKGFGSYNYPKGSYAYDVTSAVSSGTDTYTVTIENTAANTNTTLTGQLLLVVYEDATEPEIEYWITEGCDLLKADSSYCVSPEEAIAEVTFAGTIGDIANKSASLMTVVAQGNEAGTDLSFNAQLWEDVWQIPAGSSKVDIDDREVTGYLLGNDNVVDFRDTGTQGMQASNAILVVETKKYPRWDVNEDGKVDIWDLMMVSAHYGEETEPPYPRWDVNEDGKVDIWDLMMVSAHYGEEY